MGAASTSARQNGGMVDPVPSPSAPRAYEFVLSDAQRRLCGLERCDPFAAYRRLVPKDRGRPAVLFDGTVDDRENAAYAYVLFDPIEIVRVPSGASTAGSEPLAGLFAALRRHGGLGRSECDRPRFRGGAAGFLGYDLVRAYEPLPATASALSAVPELWFGIFDRGIEFDSATGEVRFFVVATSGSGLDGARARAAFDALLERLAAGREQPHDRTTCGPLTSNLTRDQYLERVASIHEYIRAGHIYQVNLAQRFRGAFCGSPRAVYERLRSNNPAPFQALLEIGDATIASCSPEAFLKVMGERVETRPIKGTRRRSGDPELDERAIAELVSSQKEVSELNMIVDLERNDLGKVAQIGSVRVIDPGRVERYSTVIHRTAIIEARLAPEAALEDLLRGAFPGGSITGVPKLRAMEIIEELEGVRRGLFTGAIGFIGFDGSAEFSIVIRTLVFERDEVHFHVGGGIVLDSDPAAEYDETLLKGQALARALDQELPISRGIA